MPRGPHGEATRVSHEADEKTDLWERVLIVVSASRDG